MILKKTIIKSKKDQEIINYYSPNNDSEKWKSNIQEFDDFERLYQELIINIGMEINDIVNTHAISEDELIEISKVVAEYVTHTRLTDFRKILFDGDRPRLFSEFRKGGGYDKNVK